MTLLILAFLGGVLTIVSPCILPVLPFVLARADQPFLKNGLPMLLGMALAFTAVATLAAVGGGWAVEANEAAAPAALGLLVVFALTLLCPGLAERWSRPLVALGARIAMSADGGAFGNRAFISPLVLGVATGLAPCAGPVLGLILTGWRRRSHVTGAFPAGRRAGPHAPARSSLASVNGTARHGGGCADRRGPDRHGAGHRAAEPAVTEQHLQHRAETHRHLEAAGHESTRR